MSVDHGKLIISASIDNNTVDGKMLRYHDFELVNQSGQAEYPAEPDYKQAYMKYQQDGGRD